MGEGGVPRDRTRGPGFSGELIEESVLAIVRRPDGHVARPGDAALGGLPEQASVGVLSEFVNADVAAVNGHGVGIGRKGDDARAVVEFDVADFEIVGEGSGPSVGIEVMNFEIAFAMIEDAASEVKELNEAVSELHVLEGARPILSDEKVITIFVMKAFADIFERIGKGPADANRFFGQGEGLLVLGVHDIVGLDPNGLVRCKIFG